MAQDEDDVARERDEVIRRLHAMPPKRHKEEPRRRLTPSPDVRQQPKRRANKKRDKV